MKKPVIFITTIMLLFGIAILWLSAQKAEKPKGIGLAVTIAVDGIKKQPAFDALAADLEKIDGIADVTTNLKTGLLTARIEEGKITLGDLVNTIAKHPRADDAEKCYGAKIVCYLLSKAEKFDADTKATIIATIKRRPGVTDITLNEDGKIAQISINATAKTRTGDIGKWFGHGLSNMGMMVSLSGPVTSLIPSDNKACNQCHAHMAR